MYELREWRRRWTAIGAVYLSYAGVLVVVAATLGPGRVAVALTVSLLVAGVLLSVLGMYFVLMANGVIPPFGKRRDLGALEARAAQEDSEAREIAKKLAQSLDRLATWLEGHDPDA